MKEIYHLRKNLNDFAKFVSKFNYNYNTFFDVGVADGTLDIYNYFNKGKIVLIEPLKEFDDKIKNITENYNASYHNVAASSKNGNKEIYISQDLYGSSFCMPEYVNFIEKRSVRAVTLDQLSIDNNYQGPFILKIDVQGAELDVLEGAQRTIKNSILIILEVSLFKFSSKYPDLFEVISYMKNKGFVAYDFFGGHNRPLDYARAQIDIAFVQEDGIFRKNSKWATEDQLHKFYKGMP